MLRQVATWCAACSLLVLVGSWPAGQGAPPGSGRPDGADRGLASPAPFADAIAGATTVRDRKLLFVAYVLPLIDAVNTEILADRQGLLRLEAKVAADRGLSRAERRWLATLAHRYGGEPDDLAGLLLRVDVVPPSLALAQAALESGWGTSRFAREGNALYGQRAWDTAAGLVPDERAGAGFAVRSFADLRSSVAAYMQNLNSHQAYAGFRLVRRVLRRQGPPDGFVLAGSITAYSEIGPDYVDQVRAIIRGNRFGSHDRGLIDG